MARSVPGRKLPPVHDWRTSDEDEIERRRLRARQPRLLAPAGRTQRAIARWFDAAGRLAGAEPEEALAGLRALLAERGRPVGCRNLDLLHARLRPHLLRRRRADVETELPARTDEHRFVPLSERQRARYEEFEGQVARRTAHARRRPLARQEEERLLRLLAMMRMTCHTNFIRDPGDRTCPKLGELEKLLDECRGNDAKVIVFSEWERMLELVRDLCRRRSRTRSRRPLRTRWGTGGPASAGASPRPVPGGAGSGSCWNRSARSAPPLA